MTTEGQGQGQGAAPSACPRCGAALAAEQRFCTSCGLRLAGHETPSREVAGAGLLVDDPAAGIVDCPRCGAANAASRRRCGRCGDDLTGADAAARPPHDPSTAAVEVLAALDGRRRHPTHETTGLLLVVVVVAGLVTAGVLVALVTARAGLLGSADAPPTARAFGELAVARVDGPDGADRIVDGDPAVAWRTDDDEPELVVDMGGSVRIRRLQVWNGDQAEDAFARSGRVRTLRIEVGDRSFVVDLLDIAGPQAVDLPDDLHAASLRLVVEDVYAGDDARGARVALSEVEVLGDEVRAGPESRAPTPTP